MTERRIDDHIYWVEVDRIAPNPYQPRKEFDLAKLGELAESIRQYGVLQPLVVTKHESEGADGGIQVSYELIAGERRLRASKLAGVKQVPVVIRSGEETAKQKLELAIIENLQREDLNAVDRAKAFMQLHKEFGMTHAAIGKKVGKSRFYVSNTLRILSLPEEILGALTAGQISEGHTRPLLTLSDQPEEQMTLFKDITLGKLSVREAEKSARKVSTGHKRKNDFSMQPEVLEMEDKLAEQLGTRVEIQKRDEGGRLIINFFSKEDLASILEKIESGGVGTSEGAAALVGALAAEVNKESTAVDAEAGESKPIDDEVGEPMEREEDPDLYNVANFSL